MCERKVKKYVCSRCGNFIFVGEAEYTECKWRRWGKRCGHLDQFDIIKCEPELCTRCSSFPADSPLPFIGTPDLPPKSAHDVERLCKAVQNPKKQQETVRACALVNTRKTYLAGEVDPRQAKRDAAHNRMLYRRLTRPLELMKIKDPQEEVKNPEKESKAKVKESKEEPNAEVNGYETRSEEDVEEPEEKSEETEKESKETKE